MADVILNGFRVQQKSDTYENWKLQNPKLGAGEIGFETDTFRMKTGDGLTVWNELPYTNYTEITNLVVTAADTTPKSLFKLPAGFFVNIITVSVDEAWLNSSGVSNIKVSVGVEGDQEKFVDSDTIDLSEAGYVFVYKINQILEEPTELKAWIEGSRTQGKLTINIK